MASLADSLRFSVACRRPPWTDEPRWHWKYENVFPSLGQPAGKGEVPSLAKEGTPRHQVNGPVPLEARPGWFVQLPMIGGLNQPPRLRPLKEASRHFLNGRSHPSLSKEGTSAFPSVVFNALGEGGPKGRMRANTSPYLSAMSSLRFAERVNHGANGHH